jgi:hypothetical protein
MAERIIKFGANHRIIIDDIVNTYKIQFYDSVATSWKDIVGYDTATQQTHALPALKDNLREIFGTDKDFALEYASADDVFRVRDLINSIDLIKLKKNTPLQYESILPVIAETARTELVATTTGVKWESADIIIPSTEMMRYGSVALEATWTASNVDSETAIELYDVTGAAVKVSVSANAGTNLKSAYVALTADNVHRVRVNVTTLSATAGATTGVVKALLYLKFNPV